MWEVEVGNSVVKHFCPRFACGFCKSWVVMRSCCKGRISSWYAALGFFSGVLADKDTVTKTIFVPLEI